jgi:uncharacterized membrane protein YphA (DoxX/SURF4 family)
VSDTSSKSKCFRDVHSAGGSTALLFVRILFGSLMVVAGYTKLSNPLFFAQGILGFDLLPLTLVPIAAFLVPWIELTAGLCILLGLWTREGAAVLFAMMGTFTVAIVSVIARGKTIECGCFGDLFAGLKPLIPSLGWLFDALGGAKISGVTIARNVFFLGSFLALCVFGGGRFALDRFFAKRSDAETDSDCSVEPSVQAAP